jgi:hypothetical protein
LEDIDILGVYADSRHFFNHPTASVVTTHLPDGDNMKRRAARLSAEQNGNVMADDVKFAVIANVQ